MSSEGPGVVIFIAQSRLQSYQQVALVEQILVVERQVMTLVGDPRFLYIKLCSFGITHLCQQPVMLARAANDILPAWCLW